MTRTTLVLLSVVIMLSGCAGTTKQKFVPHNGTQQQFQQQQFPQPQQNNTPGQLSPIVGAVIGGVAGSYLTKGRSNSTRAFGVTAGALIGAELASQTPSHGSVSHGSVGSQYGSYGSGEHPAVARAHAIGRERAAQNRLREAEDAAYFEGCTHGGGCDSAPTRYQSPDRSRYFGPGGQYGNNRGFIWR